MSSIVVDAIFSEMAEGGMAWPDGFNEPHRHEQVTNLVGLLDGYNVAAGFHVNINVLNRETLEDAMDKDVPTPVITASLHARFYSRGNGDFTHRMLSALRAQFGGHATVKATKK